MAKAKTTAKAAAPAKASPAPPADLLARLDQAEYEAAHANNDRAALVRLIGIIRDTLTTD